jgi:hypothetical protein
MGTRKLLEAVPTQKKKGYFQTMASMERTPSSIRLESGSAFGIKWKETLSNLEISADSMNTETDMNENGATTAEFSNPNESGLEISGTQNEP